MRRALAAALLVASGCAPDFTVVRERAGTVAVSSCGTTGASSASVIRAMDNPGGDVDPHAALPPERELTVCLRAHNTSSRPVRVDRSHAHLRAPRERQVPVPDGDEEVFVLQPGETRTFHVTFRYAPLASGEQATVELDDLHAAVTYRKR